MKTLIIAIACAAIAPVAFAQTSATTTTETTTAVKPTTAATTTTETTKTTYHSGTVTTFTPGKTIVVRRKEAPEPMSYTLGPSVTYVSRSGKVIEPTMIKAGVPVQVYYDPANTTTVTKVVVDQD